MVRHGRPLPALVEALRTGDAPPPLSWEPEGGANFNGALLASPFGLGPAALEGTCERLSGSVLGSGAPQPLARRTALVRGPNRRSVGGQPFVSVGLDRSVPRQIVAVGVDQIDVPPDHRPELVGGELSVGEPHAVGVGRVRGRGKGPLARLATSELLEEVHSLCGELGRPNSLVSLTREHHLLASLAPWPGCAGQVGATRAAGQAAGAAWPHPHDPG
jgi:hypothetical protein